MAGPADADGRQPEVISFPIRNTVCRRCRTSSSPPTASSAALVTLVDDDHFTTELFHFGAQARSMGAEF